MLRLLKILLTTVYIIAVLTVILWSAGWFVSQGNYPVLPTVQNDNSLPFFEINGYQFHGETFGNPDNPAVIILNGGPGSDYRMLLPLSDLKDHYFVVFYDQRGCGLSRRVPENQLTVEQFIIDLDGIVDRFAQERNVILIGHGFGAVLAAAYINIHGDKVDGAVLAEPGFLNSEMVKKFVQRINHMRPLKVRFRDIKQIAALWFKSLHIKKVDGHERMDWLLSRIITFDSPFNPFAGYFCGKRAVNGYLPYWRFGSAAYLEIMKSLTDNKKKIEFNYTGKINTYENEVLFIASSCNTITGEDVQKEQMKMFKYPALAVIPDSGYSMLGTQRERSLEVIRTYLLRVEHRQPVFHTDSQLLLSSPGILP
jgi:proline iminopeptidase